MGTDLRPADILLRGWDAGKPLAVDVNVSHAWQASEHGSTNQAMRSFLRRKEGAKKAKYAALCADAGWAFCPMAFGTWGGMGPDGAQLLKRITQRLRASDPDSMRSSRIDEARTALALTLARHVWKLFPGKNLLP